MVEVKSEADAVVVPPPKSLGQIAYEAWCAVHDGAQMSQFGHPAWSVTDDNGIVRNNPALPSIVRLSWEAAAIAVQDAEKPTTTLQDVSPHQAVVSVSEDLKAKADALKVAMKATIEVPEVPVTIEPSKPADHQAVVTASEDLKSSADAMKAAAESAPSETPPAEKPAVSAPSRPGAS